MSTFIYIISINKSDAVYNIQPSVCVSMGTSLEAPFFEEQRG